jgi:hypothetical protein
MSEMEQVLEKVPVTKKKNVDRKGKGKAVVQQDLSGEKTTVYIHDQVELSNQKDGVM